MSTNGKSRKNPQQRKTSQPRQKRQSNITLQRRAISNGITRIAVAGFKSINQQQNIEIRPLTILCGANSTGKSSIMQPLLLLKQTLEASYDPGALLLNGPNVRFTSAEQLLSYENKERNRRSFLVGIDLGNQLKITSHFISSQNKGFEVSRTIYDFGNEVYSLHGGMKSDDLLPLLPVEFRDAFSGLKASLQETSKTNADSDASVADLTVARNRCFLTLKLTLGERYGENVLILPFFDSTAADLIRQTIHLPGLRGNPERTYPVTTGAEGKAFVGTFEHYFASIIGYWQANRDTSKLEMLNHDLEKLGLTSHVVAEPINDTEVELRVSRFLHHENKTEEEMVSIADVGLGISQTLPVLVALLIANPGQLVYLEQPEIHLHPYAQFKMAEVLAQAAQRGCHLVVETHSSLLLLGIQTLVAEGKLSPDIVKFHWFDLQEDGSTQVTSADLDETGAFGDWPEDFAAVSLEAENRYLNAQGHLLGK